VAGDSGAGIEVLGLRCWDSRAGFRRLDSGAEIQALGFRCWDSGAGIQVLGFRR